jgi:hypothetical protein
VLSGRGLCDELITRPEDSYRLCCVVVCDLETSRIGAPYICMTLVTQGLKSCLLLDNVEKYCKFELAADDNKAHAHCVLYN